MLLLDQSSHDVLEMVGEDRDTINSEHAAILYSGTSVHPVVDETDDLVLRVKNNTVPSATIQVDIYYTLGAA